MKKRKLKVFPKIIISIFTLSVAIFLIATSKTEIKLETLSYEEKSNLDYKVCLNENIFYDEPCQKKGMSYVASAIDYIDINFNYNFKMNKNVDYDYEYYIEGTIIINERGNTKKVLLERPIELLSNQNKKIFDSETFNIIENLKINYAEYNSLVNSFKSNYAVNVDSTLKLMLKISAKSKYNNFEDEIKTVSEMELSIPLTESTIDITMNYKEANNSEKITQNSSGTNINYFKLGLGILLFLGSIYLFILVIIRKIEDYNNISAYDKYIKKIIKNYDRWIVTAVASNASKIEEDDYDKIIDVENFQELIDVASHSGKTILWTEINHNESLIVSWFTVEDGKRLYRKIYNSNDVEFK